MGYLDKDGLQHYHTTLQPSLVRSVTQAEYDLLTEEQKKGLFVITDAQSGSGGEAGDTGADSCGEVYSTEETRIGTWIDGKPIYRKVFAVSQANNGAVNIVFNLGDIGASLSTVINLFGTGALSALATLTGSSYGPRPVFIEPTSNNVCFLTNYGISETVYIVIEYTKTTD